MKAIAKEKNYISQLLDKISKIPLNNFFDINMRSQYANFPLSSFKTEGEV